VEAGDVLVQLEASEPQLAVEEARSALASVQAELALLAAGPRREEVTEAMAEVDDAEAALARAEAQQDEVIGGGTAADIAEAEAQVAAAKAAWLSAREERDRIYDRFDVDTSTPERGYMDGDVNDDDRAVENADYAFNVAREALAAAQARLAAARDTVDDQVLEAEAKVRSAAAGRDVAQAQLDLLKAGSATWEAASAEAKVAQAGVALERAEAALSRSVIRAPFGGVVTKVNVEVGSVVDTGDVGAVLATVDQLEAHTVDLTELDVGRVREGQAAMVTADALPEAKLQGRVARIGLRSVDYRGDVTYPVTVELKETAPELRWGMTAVVEIDVD
jgi:multidrug resistance efflux pump